MSSQSYTGLEVLEDIAGLRVSNPPVNAPSPPSRVEIAQAFATLYMDKTPLAVFFCAGRGFIAGADIKELGQIHAPMLLGLIKLFEDLPFPCVAAIHGNALGGGLELEFGRFGLAKLPVGQWLLETIVFGIPRWPDSDVSASPARQRMPPTYIAVFSSASCSLIVAMICSSVNRCFIPPSFS